jgi:hypothetical protein
MLVSISASPAWAREEPRPLFSETAAGAVSMETRPSQNYRSAASVECESNDALRSPCSNDKSNDLATRLALQTERDLDSPLDHLELAPVQSPKSRYKYRQIENQVLFAKDASGSAVISANLSNIKQGYAGDCYFLAALMAVAHHSPRRIEAIVQDNGDGTFSGRFYGRQSRDFWATALGQRNFTARVNGDLPVKRGNPAYNWVETIDGETVSWAAIIEKLWAAVNDNNYGRINGLGDSKANDHDIQNGIFAITGVIPVERTIDSLSFAQLQQDLQDGAVVVGTAPRRGKVLADHALAVLDVNVDKETVFLGDPMGQRPKLKFEKFKNTNINQYFFAPLPQSDVGNTADKGAEN